MDYFGYVTVMDTTTDMNENLDVDEIRQRHVSWSDNRTGSDDGDSTDEVLFTCSLIFDLRAYSRQAKPTENKRQTKKFK